jgi:hypothetical protein
VFWVGMNVNCVWVGTSQDAEASEEWGDEQGGEEGGMEAGRGWRKKKGSGWEVYEVEGVMETETETEMK